MRQVMENMRWHLGNWRARYSGRDWSTFTGTEKITCYVWQSWQRGAVLVLVLAFMPFLFPVALFLSFVGFICTVPLLCGAAIYYLSFRDFPLCFGITEFICPSYRSSEGFIGSPQPDEEYMLHSAPYGVQKVESRQDDSLIKSFSVGDKYTVEVPRRASDGTNILLPECGNGNERVEATNREYPNKLKVNVPPEDHHDSGVAPSSSATSHSNAVYVVRRPKLLVLPANLQNPYEEREGSASWSFYEIVKEFPAGSLSPAGPDVLSGELSKSDQREIQKDDMVIVGKRSDGVEESQTPDFFSPDVYSVGKNYLVQGVACTPESRYTAGRPDTDISHDNFMLEVYGEPPSAEFVFSKHTANTAPTGESSEMRRHLDQHAPDGLNCLAEDRMSAGKTRVMAVGTPRSHTYTPGKDVEERTLFGDSNVGRILLLSTMPSAEVPGCKSFGIRNVNAVHGTAPQLSSLVTEKRTEAAVKCSSSPSLDRTVLIPEGVALAQSESVIRKIRSKYWRDEVDDAVVSSPYTNETCMDNMASAPKPETTSVSQTSTCETCKEKLVESEKESLRSSLRFASPLLTNQRRLSFSNILADDEEMSPRYFFPSGKLNNFSPDWKQQSVSTSFSSDYPWSSESSEQGFETSSTQRAAYEELYMDTASSTTLYEEEINSELGALPRSTFCPTPEQLTEDWETRRKRWEEESTPGRLVPQSPCMEVHSVEARSICNPLFEFSTPSPAPSMHKTQEISSSPSLLVRFSDRHSPLPQSPRTSAGLAERVETCSGKFEGLLAYWRRREITVHTITSSPGQSLSPAELAHKIREEIDAMQLTIGQEVPPQYSLWKEVEVLSQIVGMKLPFMGDMSDISKAKDGLDLLKVAVLNICDVE